MTIVIKTSNIKKSVHIDNVVYYQYSKVRKLLKSLK